MNRSWFVFAVLVAFAFVSVEPLTAQAGMDMFERPAITKVFRPVAGKGAVYLGTDKDGKTCRTGEIAIVGKDSFEDKESFSVPIYSTGPEGKAFVGKSLVTPGDFQFHRLIIQPPGRQAMEIPIEMNAARKERVEENLTDWHSVGTETATVLAVEVTSFGMVKEISGNGNTQLLSKILDNAADRITGPVKQFDRQEIMQRVQPQHQQHPQP